MNHAERALAGVALALLGEGKKHLSARERALASQALPAENDVVADVREGILAGDDPLGEAFCAARPPAVRRSLGATYTPAPIVDAMLAWADGETAAPVRVVDPGAGSGRYLIAAAEKFPKAALLAVEIDPLAALLLRANAHIRGFSKRLTVKIEDYRRLSLPLVKGPTLFIGNPPYVRHHDIPERWKAWFGDNARAQGFTASKLAGLHIHFFLKTRELARPGDFGAFITAAEWLDVNYGSILRKMLADGLGGTALHVIDPKAKPFTDALTTGAITCFRVGNRPDQFTIRNVNSLVDLTPLSNGTLVDWSDLSAAPRWSSFVRGEPRPDPGSIELGELFRVHRGQVTGSNATWIENAAMQGVPARYLRPTITRARELINAGDALRPSMALRRVLDLPVDLDELTKPERAAVERFLAWAKSQDVHAGYIASHRRAWWSVGLKTPAPVLCTYMARRAPAFVRNLASARHLNIAHGLYPRAPLTEAQIDAVLAFLRTRVTTASGRIYAGGLVKFEPGELERLRIPALDRLHEHETDSLDQNPIAGRRRRGERHLPGRAP